MKKLLKLILVVAGGYAIVMQVQKSQQAKALWHEVTDPIA